ncbi:hypothetical protein [Terriglobus saanensis]|uniref:UDP-N-acetylglucosamine pyrophosphorylase n=1 Tax=Terriglobus saanensis (strain ATCC BAA-1853 / DSM 23119 / SP1PR4) TaxID=401053 RepID=E8UYG5_TERSS|nr:hypothetical protein [Terriglobus saanensis]ADV82053.1 hypothetical protein AciPR4_1228 [Terriglobus saanensis SP1PR4]
MNFDALKDEQNSLQDELGNSQRVAALRDQGVVISSPQRVFIGPEVTLPFIEAGVCLMNAIVRGQTTSVGRGSMIGAYGIASLANVQVGREVQLDAGSFTDCALLDGTKVRGAAEIRRGTVLEEGVEVGHAVGLKNSFFAASVVAGSLINFCDVYVTGGTSRMDHTEIGSGAIHFNFSPKRDKFASLFGDASGLLERSQPVFIGGNAGIVAPQVIAFGSIVPAGTTLRDERNPATEFTGFVRKCFRTIQFISTLHTTLAWYRHLRLPFADPCEARLYAGAIVQLQTHLEWRIAELQRYVARITAAAALETIRDYGANIVEIAQFDPVVAPISDRLLAEVKQHRRTCSFPQTIAALTPATVADAEAWIADVDSQLPQRAMHAAGTHLGVHLQT